jgi:hypothetical protein
VIDLDAAAVTLSAALGLSLVTERVIEFGKNLLDLFPGRPLSRSSDATDVAQQAIQDLGSRRALDEQVDAVRQADTPEEQRRQAAKLVDMERQREPDESIPTELVLVEDANDPDEGGTLRTCVLQLTGLVTGILAARIAGVHMFSALMGQNLVDWQDFLLTGLFIGGGSQPVHVLIKMISERRVPPEVEEPSEAPVALVATAVTIVPGVAAVTPAAASDLGNWVEIPYDGGVDVDKLESAHLRPGKPNLIVYHHTAMPMESTFEDVVRVIHQRKTDGVAWITGYHCVITADGGIHPFCRWDRFGNHVAGFNLRSLGISFNGNFETDPAVPFSNADGRYGPSRPTEAQLDAGARIVALWSAVYGIPLDFQHAIVPHRQLNPDKACPGSRFPADDFQRRVERFAANWKASALATARIEAFKLKRYLLVTGGNP